jgi:hypothetical protein
MNTSISIRTPPPPAKARGVVVWQGDRKQLFVVAMNFFTPFYFVISMCLVAQPSIFLSWGRISLIELGHLLNIMQMADIERN